MHGSKFITFTRTLAMLSSTTGCTASLTQAQHASSTQTALSDVHAAQEKRRGTTTTQPPSPALQTCSVDVFMGRTRQCSAPNRCVMGNPANPTGECRCTPNGTWSCLSNQNFTVCPDRVQSTSAPCTLGDHCKPIVSYPFECWCLPAVRNSTRWACSIQNRPNIERVMGPLPPPDLPSV